MKKKVHILEINNSEPDLFFLGIVTFEKEPKLCWGINEKLKINLKFCEENEKIYYSDFVDNINYKLISNKNDEGFVFSEIKNIDYILKISGNDILKNKTEFIKKIKPINFITAIAEIDISKLKKSKKILSDF